MRSFLPACVLFALVSCGGQPPPVAPDPASNCVAPPVATVEPVPNSTKLRADALSTPIAAASLDFAAPELGEHVMLGDPRAYLVHLTNVAGGPELAAIELSLDAGRPRSLPLTESSIALGQLLAEDSELAPGAHWLFVAPVLASGLVPRLAPGGPRAAKARRFFIGKTPDEAAGPSGAIWLRKPEGSYNGLKRSESVVFDAFVFSALGTPIDAQSTISLQSPLVSGSLLLPSPFALHDVPSGTYEVNVSATTASPSTTHFTVNRELGGGS